MHFVLISILIFIFISFNSIHFKKTKHFNRRPNLSFLHCLSLPFFSFRLAAACSMCHHSSSIAPLPSIRAVRRDYFARPLCLLFYRFTGTAFLNGILVQSLICFKQSHSHALVGSAYNESITQHIFGCTEIIRSCWLPSIHSALVSVVAVAVDILRFFTSLSPTSSCARSQCHSFIECWLILLLVRDAQILSHIKVALISTQFLIL